MDYLDKYLLIVSCSQRKRSELELLPAIDRYDGPVFQVVRRFLRSRSSPVPLDIYILSAEFGLIASDRPIPNYDRRITKKRSSELRPSVIEKLIEILKVDRYQEIFICAGKDYLRSLEGYEKLVQSKITAKIAPGSSGKKLSVLHDWLYDRSPETDLVKSCIVPEGKATIKGILLEYNPAEVLDIAREALAKRQGNPTNYQSYYLLIDEKKISPKWLVSQLTGLPVNSFHSIQARRVLKKLGITIYKETK